MPRFNSIAGQRVQRIEALSDGVFSIAMTLLVFNMKDPVSGMVISDGKLLAALYDTLPTLLTYFLSFMTLGIFWTGQSTQFHYIQKYDRNLSWISLFFLMFVSILPFTTGILSNHITNRLSIGIYWLNILALGTLLYSHWHYAYKHHCVNFPENNGPVVNSALQNRVLTAQSLYTIAAALCFINTYVSIIAIILIQLNYALGLFNPKLSKL
ncbi:TMEM175 family protein [Runella salmonicolor]|uniref:TMEM175 family protein n=1 Tax=Runella salmonicolor TaxID=2950278 RepID=A0ABT1FU81_9BACT|nr:TMEM175 family protein [Runella salmonicolor]MCP1385321.1 TMEM175 family protein [Runella salmonicolor]